MPAWVAEGLAWHMRAFPHDEWVFSSPGGRFLRYDNFRNRVWTGATKAAGIAPFDFHELRHTAAAFMISEGANALQVKRRMGHKDIRTTFNIYGHLFDDDEDSLVERLARRPAQPEVLECLHHLKALRKAQADCAPGRGRSRRTVRGRSRTMRKT
jgi:integrase